MEGKRKVEGCFIQQSSNLNGSVRLCVCLLVFGLREFRSDARFVRLATLTQANGRGFRHDRFTLQWQGNLPLFALLSYCFLPSFLPSFLPVWLLSFRLRRGFHPIFLCWHPTNRTCNKKKRQEKDYANPMWEYLYIKFVLIILLVQEKR